MVTAKRKATPSVASFSAARAYEMLLRARRADETVAAEATKGNFALPIHLSIGQEAISVGACMALKKEDVVFGTYRGHALFLSKGGDLRKMFAELHGKRTGSAMGKGGSMHLVDKDAGVMAMSGIVGTGIPNATGYAFGMKVQRKPNIVAVFLGDGATEEGCFHESLNFAALKKLPIIFVCENNGYAINSRRLSRQPDVPIVDRARSYGIFSDCIEDGDTEAIFNAVKMARKRILSGEGGPVFLECHTFRWKEHHGPGDDIGPGGRDPAEAAPWIENDELQRIGALVAPRSRSRIERAIEEEVADALEFARNSPDPVAGDLLTHAYAE
ncbi:MAG: thiamine pyrophosphate-dependent dehydrogenase E1 component subunit alpha [Puniceicoccales bacterium]